MTSLATEPEIDERGEQSLLLLILIAFPVVVWGADESRRWLIRHHDHRNVARAPLMLAVGGTRG